MFELALIHEYCEDQVYCPGARNFRVVEDPEQLSMSRQSGNIWWSSQRRTKGPLVFDDNKQANKQASNQSFPTEPPGVTYVGNLPVEGFSVGATMRNRG